MTDPQVPAQPDPTAQPTQPVPPLPAAAAVPVPPPYGATATMAPPQPYVLTAPPPPPGTTDRRRRTGLAVGAVLAGLLLLTAGFGIGRLTAPDRPASLIDAVRMAQQGTLPCGNPGQGAGAGGLLARLCQNGPGQGGPGQGGPGFGPGAPRNGNGNGNGNA